MVWEFDRKSFHLSSLLTSATDTIISNWTTNILEGVLLLRNNKIVDMMEMSNAVT